MTVVSYVRCERATVRIVERPIGWVVTINGVVVATAVDYPDAWNAATDLAQGIDEHEVEIPPFPKARNPEST